MKSILRLTIGLSMILLMDSCLLQKKPIPSSTVILPLTDTITLREGTLVYGLPQTLFSVSVDMERTIEKPGPYSKFAEDFLGLQNVVTSETEYWTITGLTVKTHEEVDPSSFYIIETNTLFQTNVLALKKEGYILDLNPADNSVEKIIFGNKGINTGLPGIFDLGSDEYYLSQNDTVYKRVSIDSTFIRIPFLVEKKKKLTADQLAGKAAKRLMELRDGKILILTGEANVFPQSEAAINEINRLEKEYTELFAGKSWKESKTLSFKLLPNKEMIGKQVVLFRFSEKTGPLAVSEKGGIPVTVELIPEQKTRNLKIISSQQPESSGTKYDKLFYRVPDVVNVKINKGPETLFNSRKLIYQFGEVLQLPSNYIIGK
jgi:hypothetical protein